MGNQPEDDSQDPLQDEYDFATMEGGVRGRFAQQYREAVGRLHGILAQPDGRNLTDELLAERKTEIEEKDW